MKLKTVDISSYKLVHCGIECPISLTESTDRQILLALEKREQYVYWFQPTKSVDPNDQIPTLKFEETYYQLSLRMMKCVWRHIRLKKDFKNVERAHCGGLKLKIPSALWAEKKKTQIRFQVFFCVQVLFLSLFLCFC